MIHIPSLQKNDFSFLQFSLHPSPGNKLPSSHSSSFVLNVSPHLEEHVLLI